MESVVIRFKKSQLYLNFAVGGLTMLCGVLSWIFGSNQLAGLFTIGALWVGIGLHKHISGYITLGGDFIKINEAPLSKKIDLSEIHEVRYFAGDWILKYGKGKEIYLNLNWVAAESLPLLKDFIETLQVKVQATNQH